MRVSKIFGLSVTLIHYMQTFTNKWFIFPYKVSRLASFCMGSLSGLASQKTKLGYRRVTADWDECDQRVPKDTPPTHPQSKKPSLYHSNRTSVCLSVRCSHLSMCLLVCPLTRTIYRLSDVSAHTFYTSASFHHSLFTGQHNARCLTRIRRRKVEWRY